MSRRPAPDANDIADAAWPRLPNRGDARPHPRPLVACFGVLAFGYDGETLTIRVLTDTRVRHLRHGR